MCCLEGEDCTNGTCVPNLSLCSPENFGEQTEDCLLLGLNFICCSECVDTESDNLNCGGCNNECEIGFSCQNFTCVSGQ